MFALIHNNQIVVGPRSWLFSAFYQYLQDNNLSTDITRTEPTGPIITQEYKILPVKITNQPATEYPFEQLSGPFYTINPTEVVGQYSVAPTELSFAKNALKAIVADKRYGYEVRGVNFTTVDGTVVNLYTNREDRTTYLDAFLILPDGASVTFKFSGNIFKTVSKQELGSMVQTVVGHVQGAFNWENQKCVEIDAATTMQQLRNISLATPQ